MVLSYKPVRKVLDIHEFMRRKVDEREKAIIKRILEEAKKLNW